MREIPTPFASYMSAVRSEWVDYNGHMNDAAYGIVMSEANEELLVALDLSAEYRRTTGAALYTVESRIRYLAECSLGQTLRAAITVVGVEAKKLRLHTELLADDGSPVATGDFLYLHVDSALGGTAPMPDDRLERIREILVPEADPQPDGVVTPYEGSASVPWDPATIEAPLRLHRTTVIPAWVDYNGHMSESCYLLVFGDSADAFFRFIGIDEQYRAAGHSLYTVETHLHHLREVAEGEPIELTLQLLDRDRKRVHVFHEMRHGETGALLATAEQLLVHVDIAAGRSADLPADLAERLDAILKTHAALPTPDVVGKPMGITRS